jgi:hypothetical protein
MQEEIAMAILKCFVTMPFTDKFDRVFETIRQVTAQAVPGEEIDCHWHRAAAPRSAAAGEMRENRGKY